MPPPLQRDVYATWNNGKPSTAYLAARNAAIDSVASQGDFFDERRA